MKWSAQAGQDAYVFQRALLKCSEGIFVEFGARDGVEHSNTYAFEHGLGWRGLLFEADPKEFRRLQANRPHSTVFHGAVCPRGQKNLSFAVSQVPGWSGPSTTYEPSRAHSTAQTVQVKCYDLAHELATRKFQVVDYMTIDVEGHEVAIIEDFPWDAFTIKLVQIEQLDERRYPAQRGKKARIIRHMLSKGYQLRKVYEVAHMDTDDLVFELELLSRRNRTAGTAGGFTRDHRDGSHTTIVPRRHTAM